MLRYLFIHYFFQSIFTFQLSSILDISQFNTKNAKIARDFIINYLSPEISDEFCDFTCINNQRLIQIDDFDITYNGCGAFEIFIDLNEYNLYGFNECCNIHDICYSDCSQVNNFYF
jgi:hypothetical protein